MPDNIWIRKNSHGQPRLGLVPMAMIALGVGGLIFYVSYRYSSGGTKSNLPKNVKVESDVRAVSEGPAQFKPIQVKEEKKAGQNSLRKGEEQKARVSAKPQQNVLDVTGLSLGEFAVQASMETKPVLEEDLSSFSTVFRQSTQKETGTLQLQKADNGVQYLKGINGIYTAFADPGTEFVGPGGEKYVIGDDNMLYRIEKNGQRVKEDRIVAGNFKDSSNRIYKITKNGQLRLITPGGPGNFTGPDNTSYVILPNGNMQEVASEGNRAISVILGEGEFTGSDNNKYAVYNGILFKGTSAQVSFGADKITGAGVFTDPAGQMKIVGEDGNIYKKELTGRLELSNLEGNGEFVGPDGAIYRVDGSGNVARVSKGISGGTGIVRSGVKTKPRDVETSLADEAPAQATTQLSALNGTSHASENILADSADTETTTKMAKKLKAKNVFLAPPPLPPEPEELTAKAVRGNLVPIGQKIPFYTLTEVTTQFSATKAAGLDASTSGDKSGQLVEAVIAENVYFNGAKIEAGSRMYGTFTGLGGKNRMNIVFSTILLKNGEQLKISGFTYDSSMRPGIESYYEPTAPFVVATRYANAALLVKLSEEQPVDQNNRPVGDTTYVQEAIQKTQEDLEMRYGAYNWLPAGTPGIVMLNSSVVLTDKQTGIAGVDDHNLAIKAKKGSVITNAFGKANAVGNPAPSQQTTASDPASDMSLPADPSLSRASGK
jgi:hypothetical protein